MEAVLKVLRAQHRGTVYRRPFPLPQGEGRGAGGKSTKIHGLCYDSLLIRRSETASMNRPVHH
jgi:hypothetical protein